MHSLTVAFLLLLSLSLPAQGLHGYIGFSASPPPDKQEFAYGMGFYSAVWRSCPTAFLIPPDALPFEGNPRGRFLGYSYMALPFTEPVPADAEAKRESPSSGVWAKPGPASDELQVVLVSFDPALFVTPPKGKEVGFVPIVVRQEKAR
ncbi:MAG TPA: hypothetical protein PKA88_21930 [Polyangiaceae bacterium]|nr:hypothetical protein [Polyangiaceae bacterium]